MALGNPSGRRWAHPPSVISHWAYFAPPVLPASTAEQPTAPSVAGKLLEPSLGTGAGLTSAPASSHRRQEN
jgi:hypothetical protein